MPAGDTIWRTAASLRTRLVGKRVESVWPASLHRLAGCRVMAVEPAGKHLLIRFDAGGDGRLHRLRRTGLQR